MKTINDLVNKDPQQLVGSEKLAKKDLQKLKRKKVNIRLWSRLTEIYGHQIASQYGDVMPQSWEDLLKDLTTSQIADGLNRIADRTEIWPPNAVEFRQLCLPPTASPNGGNSEAYLSLDDPRRARNDPNSPEYVKPIPKGTLGIEHVSRGKQAAKDTLGDLRGMFE